MNFKNAFILNFSIGFSAGMLICTIITSAITTITINDGNTYFCNPAFSSMIGHELLAFIVQSVVSGFFGAICMGGTVVYDIEKWSILKATITHFFITIISFFATATFLNGGLIII